jgi:hypothetical protein
MVMPQGVVSALRALRLMDARTGGYGRGCVSPPGLYCISGHMWLLQKLGDSPSKTRGQSLKNSGTVPGYACVFCERFPC